MAHWQDCVVTDAGIEMLNELMAGRRLTITGAYGCAGKADPAALESLEDLSGDKRRLDLLDVVNGQAGKTVKIQVNNSGLEESWRLEQIGTFARVDEEGERLLFLMQDEKGVEIPTQAENPSFILEIYGDIEITNDVEFHVDLAGSGAVVTPAYLADTLADHNRDPEAHPEIWQKLGKRVLTTRVRDPTKPDYGITTENIQGRSAILDAGAYTGQAEVSAIVNGAEYDALNMSVNGAGTPDGSLILKKLEE